MKTATLRRDWPMLITTCLAFGGLSTALIMCLLIGFGLNTYVGKEALYLAAGLLLMNYLFVAYRDRALKKTTLHRVIAISFFAAESLLAEALLLGICGVSFGSLWVKLPCLIGSCALPLSWGGRLLLHFRKQSQKNSD